MTLEDGRTAGPSAMLSCNAEEDGTQCQGAYSTVIKDKRFEDGWARLCPKHFSSYSPDPDSIKPMPYVKKRRRKKAKS